MNIVDLNKKLKQLKLAVAGVWHNEDWVMDVSLEVFGF